MRKITQFNNKFDVLYSRENNPCIVGAQRLAGGGAPIPWVLGKGKLYTQKRNRRRDWTGHDWLGGRGFPYKADKLCFLG